MNILSTQPISNIDHEDQTKDKYEEKNLYYNII